MRALSLEPDLDLPLARHAPEMCRKRPAEVFLKAAMTSPFLLGVPRPGADMREAQMLQQLAYGALGYSTPKRSAITR